MMRRSASSARWPPSSACYNAEECALRNA
jgi:hypothetical protein